MRKGTSPKMWPDAGTIDTERPPHRRQPTGGVDNLRKQADMTDRTCSLPDCDNPYRSKGYCQSHYARLRNHGSPTGGAPMRERAAGLICTVRECDRKVRCKGLCRTHYDRFHAYGRLEKAKKLSPDERFWSRVTIGTVPPAPFIPVAGPCWEWSGAVSGNGYGNIWYGDAYVPAHRVSYEMARGAIDPGLHIDHLCRVRTCVNPDHLEQVTTAENNRRALEFKIREANR